MTKALCIKGMGRGQMTENMLTHYKNDRRTLNEHVTNVVWNKIDQGGPVAFETVALNTPRLLSRPLPDLHSQQSNVHFVPLSTPDRLS